MSMLVALSLVMALIPHIGRPVEGLLWGATACYCGLAVHARPEPGTPSAHAPRECNARLSRQPMSSWCFPYLQPRDAPESGGQNCRSSKLLPFRGTCIHLYAHPICSYEDFDCCSRAPCHHAIDILWVFCLFATIYHSNMSW